jgi:hypothetical protein
MRVDPSDIISAPQSVRASRSQGFAATLNQALNGPATDNEPVEINHMLEVGLDDYVEDRRIQKIRDMLFLEVMRERALEKEEVAKLPEKMQISIYRLVGLDVENRLQKILADERVLARLAVDYTKPASEKNDKAGESTVDETGAPAESQRPVSSRG